MYVASTRLKRIRVRLAALFVGAALVVLALLALWQDFPRPVWLWALFALAFVLLEWGSVEVNDRLYASPTIMVVMTAAVIFGPRSAALGVATMAALGLLTPDDVRQLRWFQPAVNFGQLVLSATAGALVLTPFLPDGPVTAGSLPLIAVGSGLAAIAHGFTNFQLVRLIVSRAYGQRDVRPWSNLIMLVLPYLGMGFLGGLLGAAYHMVGGVILPLILVVFFVGRLTFASYAELRLAQESTLRGFVKALEAKDLYTRGHTERVAYFATLIGAELGFGGTRLERLRWAALIHDVGKLAVPRDLIRKRARLSDEEYEQMQAHVHLVEELLSDVEFLESAVAIASNHHVHYDGSGYHGSHHDEGSPPTTDAAILSVADAFDAMTSNRSYRVALSQEYAFAELRANAGSQFDPEVIEALVRALHRRGERYGAPRLGDEEEARRIAEGAGRHG